jgi:LmbE family N-acetylglucosaminyl deacetylase
MRRVRRDEQLEAARIGKYAALVLLDFPSAAVKDPADTNPVDDLVLLLEAARPSIIYTHNLVDRHPTHVATALRLISALRQLPKDQQPEKVLGCEVWRDLDWLSEGDRVALDVSAHPELQRRLLAVFDSQIAGGKRYDLAALGRRRAHATFNSSHQVDQAEGLVYALDLTPLVKVPDLEIRVFLRGLFDKFWVEVEALLQ